MRESPYNTERVVLVVGKFEWPNVSTSYIILDIWVGAVSLIVNIVDGPDSVVNLFSPTGSCNIFT